METRPGPAGLPPRTPPSGSDLGVPAERRLAGEWSGIHAHTKAFGHSGQNRVGLARDHRALCPACLTPRPHMDAVVREGRLDTAEDTRLLPGPLSRGVDWILHLCVSQLLHTLADLSVPVTWPHEEASCLESVEGRHPAPPSQAGASAPPSADSRIFLLLSVEPYLSGWRDTTVGHALSHPVASLDVKQSGVPSPPAWAPPDLNL